MRLPDADWQERPGLARVVGALGRSGTSVRYVGGAVRDTLLGLPVVDVDLATVWTPDEVIARCRDAGIKTIPTGIDHGTVTALADGAPVEITTLRRDVSTDGRRATVAFSTDWREDAARRDFTINALFADPATREVHDYFGGVADLEARRLRFIGNAADRIAEDRLRILRYFRFLARFGAREIDAEAFAACRDGARGIGDLSAERVASELTKLLALPDLRFAVGRMDAAGVLAVSLPALADDALDVLNRTVEREARFGIAPDPLRRLTALLPKQVDAATAAVAALKMSNATRAGIADRLPPERFDAGDMRATAYARGSAAARDMALLFAEDGELSAALGALDGWEPPEFPLRGGELIAMGLPPGPEVSATLARIEAAWVAAGFPDRDWLRATARAELNR